MNSAMPIEETHTIFHSVMDERLPESEREWLLRMRFAPVIEAAFLQYYQLRSRRWVALAAALVGIWVTFDMLVRITTGNTPISIAMLLALLGGGILLGTAGAQLILQIPFDKIQRLLLPLVMFGPLLSSPPPDLQHTGLAFASLGIALLQALIVVLFVLRVRVLRSMLILTGGVLAILASEWAIGQTIQLPFVAQISGTTAGGLLICALLEHDARHEFLSQARIYRLATIDMLSQALNRYAFFERGMLEIARTRRNQSNLALLMIDIDHFKQVNDSYGHLIGDQVIARLATICRSHIRTNDLLGRIGGEEFAILLSETDAAAAAQVGERLRMLVAANTLPLAPNPVRFTISIGVAMLEDRAWSLQDLIAHADACLYVAKRTGRNRLIERLPSEPPKLLARALGNPSLTHSD